MQTSLDVSVDPIDIETWIQEVGSDNSAVIPLLQQVQTKYGYLPRQALDLIVEKTKITAAQIYGVATFYAQFRLKPVGRHIIKICHGTACHVAGADKLNTSINFLLKIDPDKDTNSNGAYTVEDVACVGCCSQAPVMVIDNEVYGNMDGISSQKKIKDHAKKHNESI